MKPAGLRDFATQYTAAWCSQNAASVASFFAENGTLKINDGAPSIGRAAIAASAQSFMTAFPNLLVRMGKVTLDGHHATYHWTLSGTNTGPGGTGRSVQISGYEEWTIGPNGLIAQSLGHFDEADYQRQLNAGIAGVPMENMEGEAAATIRFKAAVPQFTVPDVVYTAQYYRDVLGFQIAGYWNGEHASLATDPPPVFGIVTRDAVQVFFNRADQPQAGRDRAEGANDAYFNVGGVDALATELRRRGADILDGPEDRIYQQRELVVRDCNGLVLTFGEDTSRRAT